MSRFTSLLIALLVAATASAQETTLRAHRLYSPTNLTIAPAGDLVLDPVGNDVYPAANYDVNLGLINYKFLTAHIAELWSETLVAANTQATIGGRILVGPTTALAADLGSEAGDTTITVKYNNLASGDRVYLEADGKVEWMAVASAASGAGPYTYTVTRDLDGTGRNLWYAGDAVFNTGTTGNGFIDLYSVRGVRAATEYGPSIVGNVRTGTTYSQTAPRWAIGNLNGLYGVSTTTYGAAFGDAAGRHVLIDDSSLQIKDGATALLTAGNDGNPYLRVGASGQARVAIRPTSLAIIDANNVTQMSVASDGSGYLANQKISWTAGGVLTASGWVLDSDKLSASSGAVGLSSAVTAGDDIRFWAGDATPGNAEFRVTEAGALTASNATVTGSFATSSGSFDGQGLKLGGDGQYITFNTTDALIYQSGGILSLDASSIALLANTSITGTLDLTGSDTIYIDPPSTESADAPVVYSSANHQLYYKSNAVSKNCAAGEYLNDAEWQNGILVAGSCAGVAEPSSEVAALRAEVASLRAEIEQLKALLLGGRH